MTHFGPAGMILVSFLAAMAGLLTTYGLQNFLAGATLGHTEQR